VSLVVGCGATLKSVTFSGCPQLGDEVVMAIADHCPMLEVLHCPAGVTDAAVVKLAEGCPLLVEICVSHATVGDYSVVTLAAYCPRLNNVRFGPRSDITMDAVRALAEHCPNLARLQLPCRLRHHVLTDSKLRRVKCRYQDDHEPNRDYIQNSDSNTSRSDVQEPTRRSCWSSFCRVVSYTKVT
jgi:ferredoxin-thioredoxin reductase catalytic subunit